MQSSSITDEGKIAATTSYDRANPNKLEINVPTITYAPSVCFTVTSYEIV